MFKLVAHLSFSFSFSFLFFSMMSTDPLAPPMNVKWIANFLPQLIGFKRQNISCTYVWVSFSYIWEMRKTDGHICICIPVLSGANRSINGDRLSIIAINCFPMSRAQFFRPSVSSLVLGCALFASNTNSDLMAPDSANTCGLYCVKRSLNAVVLKMDLISLYTEAHTQTHTLAIEMTLIPCEPNMSNQIECSTYQSGRKREREREREREEYILSIVSRLSHK